MSSNLLKLAKEQLREKVLESVGKCITDGTLPAQPIKNFTIEVPANKTHGDLATNIALVSAKSFKMAPVQVAQIIMENLNLEDTYFESYNIVSPGFINLFFKDDWFKDVLTKINRAGADFGRCEIGNNQKVMVEFVSANPTGPMHLGNARGGVLGDCLASVLELCGYNVTREFYINDAGNQIDKFGKSLEARYLQIFKGSQIQFPEDGYHGEDIKVLANLFAEKNADQFVDESSEVRRKALVEFSLPQNINNIKQDLKRYKIEYDVWFKESSLYKNNQIDNIINLLRDSGSVYEKDGALWLDSSKYGGEKDEVLVRANGFSTYFAADIAYHYNKFIIRNFDKVINVWGADHHGHVARLKGVMSLLGIDSSKLDIILMQLVRLTKDSQVVKMSKRTGQAITLSNLLDEVPVDAARFFFNMREASSHLDFDLSLAVQTSSENPVYYVQYAHARICSILTKACDKGFAAVSNINTQNSGLDLDNLNLISQIQTEEEKELIKMLAQYPCEIEEVSKTYDCSLITKYAVNLAASFHKFYNSHKVVSEDKELTSFRLLLVKATRVVLNNILFLMKIEAPEKM